ncbi:MAG: Ribosomal large subunit pseudouridine synthase [Verrucomicrobiota bacterium]|jgi:23S rRNA pseudouridine1911/1915/1917 synthase
MPIIIQKTTVSAESAGRVDRVVQALTGRSRSQIRGLIDHRCVSINQLPCLSDFTAVAAGDEIEVRHDPQQNYPEKPRAKEGLPFHILFEDEAVLVVEKAAHLLTVPTPKREKDTLVHLLQNHLSRGRKHSPRVEVVHRLDRGVSGILVFAKSEKVAEAIRRQFIAHKPERIYIAVVAGVIREASGTFDKNIVDDETTVHRFCSDSEDEGERAVTHWEVLQRLKASTLVRIRLETGRRNQIRVHFADAGHPVLGDPRYGGEEAKRRSLGLRMALHAASLSLNHPVTGKLLRFESPWPQEIQALLR